MVKIVENFYNLHYWNVSALEIDKKDGVQFEADKRQKNRHTGTAFVAFQNVDDFEVALKTNLTFINQ